MRALEAPRFGRRLRRLYLQLMVSVFCRFRAAERVVWPVGRAGTAAAHGGLGAKHLTLIRGFGDP
eukprot:2959825-Alexandrium_andersonii.AAC.1